MHSGSLSRPCSVKSLILASALGQVVDAVGAVDPGGDGLDLLLDGGLERVEELEVAALVGAPSTTSAASWPPSPPMGVDLDRYSILGAGLHGFLAHDLDLGVAIEAETVDRPRPRGQHKQLHVLDLLGEVGAALDQSLVVLLHEELGVDRQAAGAS